jgi:hypothetical protein
MPKPAVILAPPPRFAESLQKRGRIDQGGPETYSVLELDLVIFRGVPARIG